MLFLPQKIYHTKWFDFVIEFGLSFEDFPFEIITLKVKIDNVLSIKIFIDDGIRLLRNSD